MDHDEQALRDLIHTWHRATAAGDLPRLLDLMAEDVAFLTPGRPPMRGRDAFAAGFTSLLERHRVESGSTIEEIRVAGDWAYCVSRLVVTVTPRQPGAAVTRTGYALSVFQRRADESWVLARDANLMTGEGS